MTASAVGPTVLYEGGGFRVTETLLVTPRKSYRLEKIEFVSVTRPLLLFLGGPSLGVLGFTVGFARYLNPGEVVWSVTAAFAAIMVGALVGTLRVHSIALRDEEVSQTLGPVTRLRAVRRAVERAMVSRAAGETLR